MNKNPAKLWLGASLPWLLLPLLIAATAPAQAQADSLNENPSGAPDPRSAQSVTKELDSLQVPSRFGFSLGLGLLSATGNRGLLWQSTNPMYDMAAYYWLTPQLAVDFEGSTVNNSYSTSDSNGGLVNVNVKHLEFALRYYGDLHSILPRVFPGFISPFATLGAGVFSMTKSSFSQNTADAPDTEIGMTLGAGLRFDIVPRSLSLELLGRWNSVTFQDTYSSAFQSSNSLTDLTGQLISWNANVLVSF